jgi:predicted dehydrogenase
MSKLKVGIIGAGGISTAHLPRLTERSDAVEVAAISDVNIEAAKQMAVEYKIPRHSNDYKEWLADVDAVVICVPTYFHADIAIDALNAGKHVFCEKPLARTVEQADRMLAAAKQSSGALQVGFVRRFDDEWLSIRDSIQKERIGRPIVWRHVMSGFGPSNSLWFCDDKIGGGPFLDGCIHNIDFAVYTFGPAEWAFLHGRTLRETSTAIDTGTATVRFKSGDELMLAWSWGLPRGTGGGSVFEFLGPKGTITFPGGEAVDGKRTYLINNGEERPQENVPFQANALGQAFLDQVDEFIEVAQGKKQPRAGGQEGYESLKVALAILESGRSGQVVKI